VVDVNADIRPKGLILTLSATADSQELASAQLSSEFGAHEDPRGEGYVLTLDRPVYLEQNKQYRLTIGLTTDYGALALSGAAPATEGDWDDGLPLRVDGYDGYGGIYKPGLNFNMYTDENPDKLARFIGILEQADYIIISSSRQWGSLPRLPERFPMSTVYYRNLLGCPATKSIEWCYNVAQPGMFQGNLGFDLVQVFQSDPQIGSLRINDQPSEEAFTVYDHPKVLIFKKNSGFDLVKAHAILNSVDFSQVVHVTPKRADSHPANLMLPADRWAAQRAGGTWAELFDDEALINQNQFVTALAWYLSLMFLGVMFYPFMRAALPGLADRGYPLARLAGLLVLSYFVWLAGSFNIPFSRRTISAVLGLLMVISVLLALRQRVELKVELQRRWRYFLLVEGLFLAFFAFDLLIRLGNPDLWHPWKGGEKPMDFAYLNAVLKSTSFPPYDPWYAGGYLNYYYYGFMLVGVLIKWLGIVPAIAYNLVLPSIFAMIALGAFSLGWNLLRQVNKNNSLQALLAGIAGALGMAVLGNLGTVRMIFQGYQRLAAPNGVIEGANLLTRGVWAVRGLARALSGASLPFSLGDWYWIPSRAIPAPGDVEPITEFPFFTVLYGDPHAHLFAMPITLLALSFALAVVLGRGRWRSRLDAGLGFLLGGLAIGALRPTNTWDFYPYLALGGVAVAYAFWCETGNDQSQASHAGMLGLAGSLPAYSRRLLRAGLGVVLIIGLSLVLFQPYADWYGLGYGKIDLWKGTHTPLSAYFTHWGLFLFVILSWMAWETRQWMATTPVSALRKLEPYKAVIQFGLVILLMGVGVLMWLQVGIAWFVLPVAAWAGVLILRPGMPDTKRFVLFIVGTGLVLTLMVEVIVLRGDIGRMNTVFKFYLQVWAFFAVSAAAALAWLWPELSLWYPRGRNVWQFGLALLVAGAALYPLLGGVAKIKDRMEARAPHSLDGMAFMQYATYADTWGTMDLNQDYLAIRWMQDNIQGSPVIVEANLRNLYRWGSRFSIYTGLPGVVGWEWHQQQQRALLPGNWVSDRIAEIENFYRTTNLQAAVDFLRKYEVKYIILGQQERGLYAGEGLAKFPAAEGVYWRQVYRDRDTIIYEVLP